MSVSVNRAPAEKGRIKNIEVPCIHTGGDRLVVTDKRADGWIKGDFLLVVFDSQEGDEQESAVCLNNEDVLALSGALREMVDGG